MGWPSRRCQAPCVKSFFLGGPGDIWGTCWGEGGTLQVTSQVPSCCLQRSGEVSIEGMEPAVLQALLAYMYGCLTDIQPGMVHDLFRAADHYQVCSCTCFPPPVLPSTPAAAFAVLCATVKADDLSQLCFDLIWAGDGIKNLWAPAGAGTHTPTGGGIKTCWSGIVGDVVQPTLRLQEGPYWIPKRGRKDAFPKASNNYFCSCSLLLHSRS